MKVNNKNIIKVISNNKEIIIIKQNEKLCYQKAIPES